jgi:uncharacterized protein
MATPTPTETASRRVVVTGSSGLIGTALCAALVKAGHPVTKMVRRSPQAGEAQWDPAKGTIDATALEGAWAVVHLAGVGIGDAKWTEAHKKAVLDSRVQGTTLLATTMARLTNKPSVFGCGSAIGYYGDRQSEALTESSSRGTGFLADVVDQWEACGKAAEDAGIRTVYLRTGVVLSTKGGALKKQLLPFKLGIGGRFGSGEQYLPWIEIDDEVRAVMHCLNTTSLSGPVNLTAPNPVNNNQFTKALGKAVHRPTFLPTPLFPVKLLFGAEMVKEMILGGANVLPRKLQESGFTFTHTEVGAALAHLLKTKS